MSWAMAWFGLAWLSLGLGLSSLSGQLWRFGSGVETKKNANLKNLQQIQQEEDGHQEADPYVRAVCFSPDGLSIVAGMEKNSAKILLLEEDGGRQGATTLAGHEVRSSFQLQYEYVLHV